MKYYKRADKPKQQLIYINQLIKIDSILHQNEVYLNKNLIRHYDIPKLMSEKEDVINKIKSKDRNKKLFIYLLSLLFLILLTGFYYQFSKRKLYKKRFLNLINEQPKRNEKK